MDPAVVGWTEEVDGMVHGWLVYSSRSIGYMTIDGERIPKREEETV